LLVATDFTRGAAAALERAALLPLGPRARITLLHVLPHLRPTLRAAERAEAKRRLAFEAAALLRGLRLRGHRGVRVVTAVATGDPFAEIVRRARGADLILLGRHGTRRFRDLLLGSTAERVIRAGHVPVLLAAAPAARRYRRTLLAVDRSPVSRRAAEVAARVVPADRKLEVVHVYETAHDRLLSRVAGEDGAAAYTRRCRAEALEEVTALLHAAPGVSPVARIVLRRGEPRSVILDLARELEADLLAVGSHGRAPVLGTLVGSVAEGVVRHAACDALIVPPA
jgi:nucleotide-binding universal stress UspA family protein